jgi:hypothetical protein
MRIRIATVVILAAVLGACTDADWDHALSYVGADDSASNAPPPAATPIAATTAPTAKMDSWCDDAAQAAAREARKDGFDAATQRRQAESARAQCLRP